MIDKIVIIFVAISIAMLVAEAIIIIGKLVVFSAKAKAGNYATIDLTGNIWLSVIFTLIVSLYFLI